MTLQYPNLLINGDALSHVDLVVLKIMRGSNPQIRPPDTLEQNHPWASDVVVSSLLLASLSVNDRAIIVVGIAVLP